MKKLFSLLSAVLGISITVLILFEAIILVRQFGAYHFCDRFVERLSPIILPIVCILALITVITYVLYRKRREYYIFREMRNNMLIMTSIAVFLVLLEFILSRISHNVGYEAVIIFGFIHFCLLVAYIYVLYILLISYRSLIISPWIKYINMKKKKIINVNNTRNSSMIDKSTYHAKEVSSRYKLDDYVNRLIQARSLVSSTSFFLGENQPSYLMSMGREIAKEYGCQGLEYVTQQIRIKLKTSHPYDGRELEAAWEVIWYEYR